MILGFGDGMGLWCPLAERHPLLMACLLSVGDPPHGEYIAGLIDEWPDDFPAGEPPVFGENQCWRGGFVGWGDGNVLWGVPCKVPPTLRHCCACRTCVLMGKAIAAVVAGWFYCEVCTESFHDPDELGGIGLCRPCHAEAQFSAMGCYWCGPGVPQETTDSSGRYVCHACAASDDVRGSPEDDDYDSTYEDE